MKKFEYKVFNQSELKGLKKKDGKPFGWMDMLNVLGADGWDFTGWKPTDTSFFLKREIVEKKDHWAHVTHKNLVTEEEKDELTK